MVSLCARAVPPVARRAPRCRRGERARDAAEQPRRRRDARPGRTAASASARSASDAEDDTAVAERVERETRAWLDTIVMGLNLCPFARAALPAPGAWFEQRAPYAALLEASSCLASASSLAAARPESWRRFVASRPEALEAVATLAAWAAEPARLDALALLARAAPHGDEEASTLGGAALRRASGFGVSKEGTITVGKCHPSFVRGGSGDDGEAAAADRAAAEAVTSLVVGSDFGNFFRFFLGTGSAEISDATRAAARAVARAAWRASPRGSSVRREMARATFAALPGLAPLGARAREAFELARWFAESADADTGSAFGDDFLHVLCDTSRIVDALAEALASVRAETVVGADGQLVARTSLSKAQRIAILERELASVAAAAAADAKRVAKLEHKAGLLTAGLQKRAEALISKLGETGDALAAAREEKASYARLHEREQRAAPRRIETLMELASKARTREAGLQDAYARLKG